MQYRHLLEFTRQAEQALLDYLKLVNGLPPDLSEDDLRLIREDAAGKIAQFTGFSIRDILDTALAITVNGVIVTVRQMDHLVRVRQACETLQLGSVAALELGALRGNSSREDYRSAAEGALSSLTARLDEQAVPSQGELGQSETSWIVVDTQRVVARSTDKARCLLTVKDFLGRPLANITVTWETSLSRLDSPSSDMTDGNGQVWIYLQAGEEMGVARVTARFGLDRQVLAPLIQIDCQVETLYIKDPVRAPDEVLAGNLQAIEYRLNVLDTLGNVGRDQIVEWSTDLGAFERPRTHTDADGVAIAHLRSRSSGVATVTALLPVNGEQESFEPVTFLEQLYFQYVRFNRPLAAGQPETVTCRVVNLDGSPARRVTVLWSTDFGGFVDNADRSISDDDGIAVIDYLSPEPGEVTVTVNARFDHKDLQPLSTARTRIHETPTLVEMEPAEQYYGLYQAGPAVFRVRLEPTAAGYPVTWWAGDTLLATTYTNVEGWAGYQMHFKEEQLGEHLITVKSLLPADTFDFKVTVVQPHTRLESKVAPGDPGIAVSNAAERKYAVDVGLISSLQVFAERLDGVGDDGAQLTFSLGDAVDPATLGVVFDPPLGQTMDCDPEGKVTLRVDCTNAAFHPGSDPIWNDIQLRVESNLGVTLIVWFRLRYFLDLKKSELHFFRGPSTAGLAGRLCRANPGKPPILRENHKTFRLTLDGAAETVETGLFTLGDEVLWLCAPSFSKGVDELGSGVRFSAFGDLGKRVHFVGSPIFEPQRIISDARLTITPVPDEGVIEDGARFVVDEGLSCTFDLTLTDGEQAITGVPLLGPKTVVNGVDYLSTAPTDDEGRIRLDVHTKQAVIGLPHALPLRLGPVSDTLDLHLRVLVSTSVIIFPIDTKRSRVTVGYGRIGSRKFPDIGYWSVSFFVGSVEEVIPIDPYDWGAVVTTTVDSNDGPTLRIDVHQSAKSRFRLIGETEFSIT